MRNSDAIAQQRSPDPTGRIYYRKIDIFCEAVSIVIMLIIVFFMFCAVFWLGSHYAKPIQGSSMQPNINNYASPTGDIAIVSNTKTFSYSDIIIVDMNLSQNGDTTVNTKLLIKRAIAFGGDSLRLVKGSDSKYHFEIKRSGESAFTQLDETYANPMTSVNNANAFYSQNKWTVKLDKADDGSITIPSGYMFFVGDNRDASYDCRIFGPVETNACVGVVETILKTDNFWNKIFSFISSLFAVKHSE